MLWELVSSNREEKVETWVRGKIMSKTAYLWSKCVIKVTNFRYRIASYFIYFVSQTKIVPNKGTAEWTLLTYCENIYARMKRELKLNIQPEF